MIRKHTEYIVTKNLCCYPVLESRQGEYDASGRLTKETIDHSDDDLDQEIVYVNDLVGNRVEKQVDLGIDGIVDETEVSLYDTNDRLLDVEKTTSAGTADTTYSYDHTQQTGKTERDTTNTVTSTTIYSYDLQGQMSTVAITTGGQTKNTAYTYDSTGYRVKVTTDTDSTEYLVDYQNHTGYSQTIRETHKDTNDAVTKTIDYTFGHDEISQTVTENSTTTTHVFHHDGHGSVRVLTDLAAAVLEIYSFDAYGNALGFNPAAALTTILYSGETFDSNINQQYLRARWYDASTGRFNRLDPFFGNMNDPQSLHKYLYTHANPVNGVDPSGEFEGLAGMLGSFAINLGYRAVTYAAIGAVIGGGIAWWNGGDVGKGALNGAVVGAAAALGLYGIAGWDTSNQIIRPIPPAQKLQDRVFAQLADAAYDSPGWRNKVPAGWNVVGPPLQNGLHSGYFGRVFTNPAGDFVVAFAGTDDWPNWQTNLYQGLFGGGLEYSLALADSEKWVKTARQNGKDIHFIGHSLGGGLATASAFYYREDATTFNAAGVHPETVGNGLAGWAMQWVRAYRVQGEILSTVQDSNFGFLGFMMPDGNGDAFWLRATSWNIVSRHLMPDVLNGFDKA